MADDTQESVMDVINEALGTGGEHEDAGADEGDTSTDEGVGEAGGSEDAAGDSAASDKGDGDGEGEGGTGEGEGDGEEGKDATGRERRADGTFKKVDKKEGAGEDPAAAAAAAAAKKPDPLNDPIPKDLAQSTQERIRTLIKTTKEASQERDKFRQDFDYLVQGVQATGASPEQYGEALSWLALFNSNDPKQQEKALELVENVAERLATLLGKERTTSDPLKGHVDLQQAMAQGKITREYAAQIATNRNATAFRGELSTVASRQQQEQQQAERELAQARTDLNTLEAQLKKDPQYAAKREMIVPMLKPIFKNLAPSQWAAAFQQAYQNARVAPAAARKPAVPANQPMRAGKNPAGGGKTAPGSMLDAVNGALAGLQR